MASVLRGGYVAHAVVAAGCLFANGVPAEPANAKAAPPIEHWAFRVPVRPIPPLVKGPTLTAIDQFILALLERKGQTLNPEADRPTLIRRVSFTLTGLPPTLAEIDDFLADKSADAYERMVERYLASPRYGERWGKHWLDTAGYADSNGYFNADSDRPLAWRYRDYVIRAFNADKHYDRFVMEQLAGDELVGYRPDGDVTADMVEPLTATHFLRNAPDGTGESDGNPDEVRIDRYTVLEGTVQIAMNSLLGITIQCARCHNHKFEPISQQEYYGLQALFFPAYNPERWTAPKDRMISVGTRAERDEWRRRNEVVDKQVKALQAGLTAFAQPLREQFLEERLKNLDGTTRAKVLEAVGTTKEKLTAEQQALLKAHAKAVAISDEELAKRFPEYAALRDQVRKTTAEREKDRPRPLDKLSVFVESDPKPPVHHVLRRGQHNQPGEEVVPRVLKAVSTPTNRFHIDPPPVGRISTGRRTAFARWVTSPDNPLIARVMVNRIWQHHFGVGLVATPDNFGKSGARPTHPELLDWLACEFMSPSSEKGAGEPKAWSVKAMHRLILRSAIFRQSSAPRDDLAKIDPDNHLLGRFPLRRLDAEALRDGLLSVSAELDLRVGGAYVPTKRTAEGIVVVSESDPGAKRRSVYLQQRRTQVDTFLQLFDAPSLAGTCSMRNTSTIPLQALALLNSEFARERAKAFARRLIKEVGPDADQRLTMAFRLACGRPPVNEERESARRFLVAQEKLYAQNDNREQRVWTDLCQMILASNAFLYVE